MAKFNLNKGERFSLKKSEGLTNIKIELGWVVPEKFIGKDDAPDPDASTFLLGPNGLIMDDADFVYYNSNNREEAYSREKFGHKRAWREETYPVSKDGSVRGPHDDRSVRREDEDARAGSEEIFVDLEKVNPKITEIVFCASMYNHDKYSFGDVEGLYIAIINEDDDEELCRYNLNEKFKSETAVVAGRLLCDDEGEWTFEAVGKGFIGGLQTLTEIYAEE